MDLMEIVGRDPEPAPWSEGEKIPWNEPGFSARMLREHLSQEHDWASRRASIIDRHVDWIQGGVLENKPARVLDLGCGPGLYTSRLAARGNECEGIDFSPASIEYARRVAEAAGLHCRYQLEDVRQADFGSGYGLAMFIFGELNVFRPQEAARILEKAHAALLPGGALLLEVHSDELVNRIGHQPASWYSAQSGLFSDRPHLCLQESFWSEADAVATQRYLIVDAETGRLARYASSMQAYSEEGYRALLAKAGFRDVDVHASLTGSGEPGQADLFVLLARA
ncbi:MAG TPA: class I SAM-dependent methyltransferase [Anaerolineales bacterium]|nr:class I SAM-dependent methyltransferase [Anaerolineales bacterium]